MFSKSKVGAPIAKKFISSGRAFLVLDPGASHLCPRECEAGIPFGDIAI